MTKYKVVKKGAGTHKLVPKRTKAKPGKNPKKWV